MRELQLWEGVRGSRMPSQTLPPSPRSAAPRIAATTETCAVEAATKDGSLEVTRLSYRKLQRELARLEQRQKSRAWAEQRSGIGR